LVGRVVRRGERGLPAEGTRVVVDPAIACGRCRDCRHDRANLCPTGGLIGRDVDGGFTELLAVDEDRLLPVPDHVPLEAAVSLQILGTCVHAQRTVSAFPGETAVVIGLGVSGFLMLQLLRARGLQVVGVTRSTWKRALGERLGATAVAAPDQVTPIVRELTGGTGADLVVEAVGTVATLNQAIALAANGGHSVLFGTIGGGDQQGLDHYRIYHKELTLHGTRAALRRDYADGIALSVCGVLDLGALYTHEFPLNRAPEAFAALERDPTALKVAFTPAT
ncbi:MAG TPA: zinc-binding dehydrogenase, partial [Euzebyales bacterium]|nr:zinc-binding dehydrogenase [Euzebyales bacterium]